MTRSTVAIAACAALLWAGAALAVTPEQKCQGSKNKAAGKYAFCRQGAEKGLALNGDALKYGAAIGKCEQKFSTAWQKADSKAAAAGATCPDAPLLESGFKTVIDGHTTSIATALDGGGWVDCAPNLAICTADLGTCNGDLGTCTTNYTSCSASLGTCNTNYSNCASSLATCNAGTATAADVLIGKTFSSSAGLGLPGTMPDNGAVSITPGVAPQTIAAGYHNGSGTVAGDADLLAGNIKIGVSLFGVAGTLGCGNGAIDAGEQCDQDNLNGESCVTQGYGGGTLRCAADCAFGTSDCYAVRFVDNGDGTITDAQTGLMWEKKGHFTNVGVVCANAAACPDPHDADNLYTYSFDNPLGPPGTAYTVFLVQLNAGGGFAGHTDWRLPTRAELQGIVDYADASSPVVNAVFDASCSAACSETTCSCTAPGIHWSSELVTSISGNAWEVDFSDGAAGHDSRDTGYHARGVRGL